MNDDATWIQILIGLLIVVLVLGGTFYFAGLELEQDRQQLINEKKEEPSKQESSPLGESVEDMKKHNEGRRWVMLNVYMGQKWDPAFWVAKFGDWKQLEVDRGNPAIIKACYFESIDMTLIVNVLKGEIDTWRDGEAHH